MSLLLAGLSAIVFGASDFVGGLVSRRVPVLVVVIWTEAVGLVMALLISPMFGGSTVAAADIGWSSAAGLAGAAGLMMLYQGLATGRMSVVAPLSAVTAALLPVSFGLMVGERPGTLAWIGVAFALPAIWLVSSSPAEAVSGRPGARWGIGAGAGFGLFFIFVSQTPAASGLWPLAVVRVVSVVALLVVAAVTSTSLRPPVGNRLLVAVVGIGDMTANILFLLAVRVGLITLVGVISSLYPAMTVVLAAAVLGERIHRSQGLGLMMALLAVGLIAADPVGSG